ncbi:MAG TPA: hypothetical protein VF461_15960 [Gemmatimonadaceae bacterium]
MAESTRTSEPVLTALANDFDIVGELGGAPGTRFLLATRKPVDGQRRDDSGNRVIIGIVRSPEGDESHALDHVASDTKLLSTLRHRRLVPILEGRWVGDDAFAVVREQVDDPSVGDLLERGDPFTNVRTAAILREVHGLLQWAREHDVVHRRVTTDRVFLEPTSDRVRVSFAAGPLQRVRATDATTEDVQTVVRLAVAMLSGAPHSEDEEGQTFAERRPDLPERLHEETERLLKEPATDHDLTLYLALIGMADPVAEGETERDRIRAEVLEEQRVEREKIANERAELQRQIEEERQKLIAEGEELRGAFEKEKANLEREFAAAQRMIAAERTEMQRTINDERAELSKKRDALERTLKERIAEIDKAAASDRATIEALRERIQKAGDAELEKMRAAALEELEDSEIKLNTGRYATPRFVEPQLEPFPQLAFKSNERKGEKKLIEPPKVDAEPALVVGMVERLKTPNRPPVAWKRWAVRGGIAAVILITAGTAMVIESRSPDYGTAPRTAAPRPNATAKPPATATTPPTAPPTATPAPAAGEGTTSTANGAIDSTAKLDSAAAKAQAARLGVTRDSSNGALDDSVTRARRAVARRDSAQRAQARDSAASEQRAAERREAARRDSLRREAERRASAEQAPATGRTDTAVEATREAAPQRQVQTTRRDDQDLMLLSDSLSKMATPPPAVTPTGPVTPPR